jgi:hypothetical protein
MKESHICKRCGSDKPRNEPPGWFLSAGWRIEKRGFVWDEKLDIYFCSKDCLESYWRVKRGQYIREHGRIDDLAYKSQFHEVRIKNRRVSQSFDV